MDHADEPRKHTITWAQFEAFARGTGRDLTHVFRVFKGERKSAALRAEFQAHFGFAMAEASLAGTRRNAAAWKLTA